MDALDPALRPSLARRLGAYALDVAILAAFVTASQLGFRAAFGDALLSRFHEGYDVYRWTLLTVSIPVWSYFIACESLWSATLGKRLLGLEVRAVEGPMNAAAAFRRTVVKMLPLELAHVGILLPEPLATSDDPGFRWPLMLANVIGLLLLLSVSRSPSRQGWHDRAAGTVVVRRTARVRPPSP